MVINWLQSTVKFKIFSLAQRLPFFLRIGSLYVWHKIRSNKSKIWVSDGVMTIHDQPFSSDPFFINSKHSARDLSPDFNYDIDFRLHQGIFAGLYSIRNIGGHFVELGTGNGMVFFTILDYINRSSDLRLKLPKVFLFDTFLPYKVVDGEQLKKNGKTPVYTESIDQVKKNFEKLNLDENLVFVQGSLPNSLFNFLEQKLDIGFLHLDLNAPEIEIACLDMLWEQILPGGIILIDDYAYIGFEKTTELFKSYFLNKERYILTTATGQGIVIK